MISELIPVERTCVSLSLKAVKSERNDKWDDSNQGIHLLEDCDFYGALGRLVKPQAGGMFTCNIGSFIKRCPIKLKTRCMKK